MASKFELEKPVFERSGTGLSVSAVADDGNTTLTAAQSIESFITMTPDSGGHKITTASAADIVAAIPGVQVGTTVRLIIQNMSGTNTIALVLGNKVERGGNATQTLGANKTSSFLLHVTNIKDPEVYLYALGQATT